MKFYLISDNVDTKMGMRLAGIDGVVVHTEQEVKKAVNNVIDDPEIAIILITDKLVRECSSFIYNIKLNRPKPLIVEVPDRHATSDITTSISRYVQEAIGVKL